jgi:adenylate cyclase
VNAREILARGGAGRRAAETRYIVTICATVAAASFIFGYVRAGDDHPAVFSGLQGIFNALLASVPLIAFEIKGRRFGALSRLRSLPFAWFFALKVAVYLAVLVASIAITRRLFAGLVPQSLGFDENFREILFFAALMSLGSNLVIEVGMLIGFGTLGRLLTGRYFQPRREELVFAVIDMTGSTSVAERLGDLEFHALLNAFFADIGNAAYDYDAEIHKYVGDEAILSWPVPLGLTQSRAVLCVFAAAQGIERRAVWYRERFGLVPSFRAALHMGTVAAGEIGQQRREIAYVGDTLNTAARLLDAAKEMGRDVLVSDELLAQAALPTELKVEKLPTLSVRGRAQPLAISALREA